jgi:nitroimidazol reductase NimA-like FMN-containing flavoprotein (pyridoxamine 5'-phosphate oxidase superfamily)
MNDARLEVLDDVRCLEHLRSERVGRIGIAGDHFPIVLPVNYRLVEAVGLTWIALRTRPGNVIDRAPAHVAFEIDGIDLARRRGWSVLVRGTLLRVNPDAADFRAHHDADPWFAEQRDAWLVIEPFAITGRELHPEEPEWAFHLSAYL